MKLTSSPSLSTPTFTGIFPTSKASVFGCISFVFRRILCTRSLPTHPFDQFNEIDSFQNQKSDSPPTPNLVARLMGLEPMPETNAQKDSPPISRRKSMNEQVQRKHRRAKTSVYFDLTDDFFVLSFENGRRNTKCRVRKAISEKGDEHRRRITLIEGRNKKKKKEKCLVRPKAETESDESQNLSPVSVLDHTLFISDHEELPTSEGESKLRSNLEHISFNHNSETCSNEDHNNEVKQAGLLRKDYHSVQNTEMLKQICRLAESEMADSEWACNNKRITNLNKWEVEIGAELSLQIVNQLVNEVVNQLLYT